MTESSSLAVLLRRNRPGTKKKELFAWEKNESSSTTSGVLIPSSSSSKSSSSGDLNDKTENEDHDDFDNPLIVQEIIQKQIRKSNKKVKRIISIPKVGGKGDDGDGDENTAASSGGEPAVDKDVWIYEHMRQFMLEINLFILAHKDVCTKETQPEMKISSNMLNNPKSNEELMYLCPVFTPPESVPAIDYMVHIHTQSTSVLNDPKLFPSRTQISKKAMKEIKTLCRRVYRIFAFSYYVHPEEFIAFEKKTHLAERFQRFLKKYDMMSSKDFLIPDDAFKA
ncbi:hypothetical protein FDP41_004915 [Naegleria fowleri]|uniref:Uncharacterized protein n=1 Tax=Naegleria fowleri TaxID=5763 RepID=A0A6A5BQY0_NAEFO|nr:uncharacterized protein FDP41_004915 [Naegleria fowleri]KAF0976240.1 hypothetical protein FDP41_004915 [Naegleria fowleri]CAG4713523.1 unnamed protein product [Naegleria fowleri]